MIVILDVGHWPPVRCKIQAGIQNPQDFRINVTVMAVFEVLEHERIEPASGGVNIIGIADRFKSVIGQVLDEQGDV